MSVEAHATMVIKNIYVEWVKGQLAAHEAKEREKHSGSRGTQLLSDGMPHTLTGEDFMGAVMAHHQAAQAEVEARKVQATAKAVHKAAITEWETLEAALKQRNKKLTLDHKAQHAVWVALKQLAKDEGRPFRKPAPKRGKLEPPLAQPVLQKRVAREQTPGEDFTQSLVAIGEEEEEEDAWESG